MEGRQISDDQWQRIEGFLPGRPDSVGVTARDNRLFVDGVLWVLRSGAEWKDLPGEYGKWKTSHKRYTRWARSGIWKKVFQVLLDDPDNRYVMIDSTIVRTHQQAVCGKGGGQGEAVGRSRGGLSTRIHMVTDAQGQPVRFALTGGQEADAPQAISLLTGIETEGIIADKGYESNGILAFIRDPGAAAVIPPKSNRKDPGSMTGNCTGPGI